MISEILTHTVDAVATLVSQFKNSSRLIALISVFSDQVQEVEDALQQLLSERSLTTSAGAQRDGIGSIVGEPRMLRSDVDYLQAIYKAIGINTSKGTGEDILRCMALLDPDLYEITPYPYACMVVRKLEFPLLMALEPYTDLLRGIKPAGVLCSFQYSEAGEANTFEFASGDVPEASLTQGFCEDDFSNGGYFSEIAMV
jgi:hypothetical protein